MILKGNIIYMADKDTTIALKDGYLIIDDGIVKKVYSGSEFAGSEYVNEDVTDYGNRLIIPGMTDLHLHASQFGFLGLGMDEELMEWLNEHAFKEEAKFSDIGYAEAMYSHFADELIRSPTTRACIFTTIHKDSAFLLAKMLDKLGFSAYVGKVNMDRESPPELTEDMQKSAEDTETFINGVISECKNVRPIITPRFVPSCTDGLMKKLGDLRAKYGLSVQSHLSENPEEIDLVKQLNPEARFYGDAYDIFGLFGGGYNAVMAHCVYSSDLEMELMRKNGVFIAHCANSNYSLSSGIAPIRKYLEYGLKVGLGTDIAGGFSISMFRAIQDTIAVSKLLWRTDEKSPRPVSFKEAFYLATMGGGEFFGKVGSFIEGFEADILVLDDSREKYPLPQNLEDRLERICYLSDNGAVYAKYIKGNLVMQKGNDVK
ncbi:MAG: amidohydrolase family protein [Dorea sp.]|nr:amidohydrolase family protein [Dorea sp.]